MRQLGKWQVWQGEWVAFTAPVLVPQQEHGGRIAASRELADKRLPADGVVAGPSDRWIGVITADCMPLVLVNDQEALALHVSRKTLIHGLLDAVPEHFSVGSDTDVWIGPHICADHFVFEWAGDDIVTFRERWPAAVREDKDGTLRLSLSEAVAGYLRQWGVRDEAVTRDGRCQFETQELPSYRRELERGEKVRDQWLTAVRCREGY